MNELRRTENNYSRWDGTEQDVDASGAARNQDTRHSHEASDTPRTTSGPASLEADWGATRAGDGVYAAFAVLKHGNAAHGMDLEVLSVSAQVGSQMQGQAAQARITKSVGSNGTSVGVEVLGGRAGIGVRNADGSVGFNAGASANAVGVEGTVVVGSASSFTLGVALGVGVEGSVGRRDIDADQASEICVRASYAWWTVGACVELPHRADDPRPSHAGQAR